METKQQTHLLEFDYESSSVTCNAHAGTIVDPEETKAYANDQSFKRQSSKKIRMPILSLTDLSLDFLVVTQSQSQSQSQKLRGILSLDHLNYHGVFAITIAIALKLKSPLNG